MEELSILGIYCSISKTDTNLCLILLSPLCLDSEEI